MTVPTFKSSTLTGASTPRVYLSPARHVALPLLSGVLCIPPRLARMPPPADISISERTSCRAAVPAWQHVIYRLDPIQPGVRRGAAGAGGGGGGRSELWPPPPEGTVSGVSRPSRISVVGTGGGSRDHRSSQVVGWSKGGGQVRPKDWYWVSGGLLSAWVRMFNIGSSWFRYWVATDVLGG